MKLSQLRSRVLQIALAVASLVLAAPADAAPARLTNGRAVAVTASDEDLVRFFDGYMRSTMKTLGIPGGAVVVVRDGHEIFARGYGYADVKARRPVDVDRTLFRAASASKILPWLLVMQLVEEGRLDLDADVNRYLDFKIRYRFGKPITMRHLMTHTAGFADRFHGVFDQDLSHPLGAMLRDNIPRQVYPPGTTVAYSNWGAALAGYVVQRLRQRPWTEMVGERIFGPVGMTSSTVEQPVPATMRGRLAATYSFGSDEPMPFRFTPLAPMGSLTPTAADMGRLLLMLSNGGRGQSGKVLSAGALDRMFSLQQPLGPGLEDGFGLGFLVGRHRGVRYAGHAGNMSTLATDLEVLPDAGIGWYYVFNSQGEREGARDVRWELLTKVIDRFVVHDAAAVQAHGPSSAGDVEGKYSSTRRIFSGPLFVTGLMDTTDAFAEKDGSLSIVSAGHLTHWLPQGRDRFVEDDTGTALAVTRDEGGHVRRIASAALYDAAVFERAPALVVIVPIVAASACGIYILYLLTRFVGWLFGRRKRKQESAAVEVRRQDWLWRSRRAAIWLVPGAFALWAICALALAIDFTLLFRAPILVPAVLGLLAAAFAPAALILAVFVVRSWRERGVLQRIGDVLVTVATAGFAWLAYTLDFVNLTANW